jgi:choice-of-anchor A domain-containing protein
MYDQVTLQTGTTESGVSVFSFPSSLLAGCTGLTIIAPAGQLVLINIPGATNSISDFQITLQGGVDAAHVLWNYYEATSLSIENVYVIGTTIAPSAAVTFTAGQLHGALYAGSISGIGEYHPQVSVSVKVREGSCFHCCVVSQPPVIPICPICPVNPCN